MLNARIKQLRSAMAQDALQAILITHLPNIRYLCSFTGSSGALLITEDRSTLFTDGRYCTQAREEVKGAQVVVGKKAPALQAVEWLAAHKRGRIALGMEGEHVTVATQAAIRRELPPRVRIKPVSSIVERQRVVKDITELARIRRAVQLGSGLFQHLLRAIRPGATELEVAAEIEYQARRAGAEGMSFEAIIASGKRSALPHGRASAAKICNGFVVCDFGVILAGYCSDMTRTVHVGQPSPAARIFYQAVLEAQQAALDSVRAGISTGEVDAAARKLLKKRGLEKFFTHSTGHGVGLEIHEAPRVAAGQNEILEPGMVITIEPGAYVSGKWGVRIEDMVAVTERGCEVLTPTSKELVTI
jgi:Xaa-Pro aminopeptidase